MMHQVPSQKHRFGDVFMRLFTWTSSSMSPLFFKHCHSHPVLLCSLLLLALSAGAVYADEKKVIGWIERVSVTTERLTMEAKVDTGADFSSVHAEAIRYFLRDGVRWVEFTLRDQDGNARTLERPLERMARVKKKTTGFQERPVVVLQICIGDARHTAQVNLAQRGQFKYPLLLGRGFLRSRFLVDPSEQYLLEPSCP
jgi:hypothetical protein